MTIFLDLMICLLAVTVIWACFMLVRNEAVYRVRMRCIDLEDRLRTYESLPEYREMLYSPNYWLLWTFNDWMAWLNRRETA